ncbi:MAG TPA: tyrosine-type recombinase/integrase, partial [Acidimicrobiales bacterium]|nr:tyrosine-type recombinase/integrase [Acidimicrobiales bacterium]
AGVGHVHPHRLRHTVATQAINRGMRLEAVAALLGHKNLEMTLIYARIADRTVAEEYFDVSTRVDHLYSSRLPADAEGPNMRRLRQQHHRLLGNGWCERPAQMDCHYETICETSPTTPPIPATRRCCSANATTPGTTTKPAAPSSTNSSSTAPRRETDHGESRLSP